MMPHPVSICLTTYNRAASLKATIESILDQTFREFELIISDDCSTDQTEEICHHYASTDKRVVYRRNTRNLKMPGNLNAAIQQARGQYIANLHDGDTFRADLIEQWKRALDENRDAPYVFNAYEWVGSNGASITCAQDFSTRVPGQDIAKHYFETMTSCVWGTVMARASSYSAAGPFDAAFGFISDVDMWLRLARNNTVAYLKEPLIRLTEREPDHPYALHSWQHLFWTVAIYRRHFPHFQRVLNIQDRHESMMRYRSLRGMLSLIKHGQWQRMREGFAVWRDSDDRLLQVLGGLLGNSQAAPEWYRPHMWNFC